MTPPLTTLPHRAGSIPEIIGPAPHGQRSQIAPVMVQEELWFRMRSLPYTYMAPTLVSVSHARALHLAEGIGSAPPERFQRGREFAHLHPHNDGSLHLSVSGPVMEQVVGARWGVPHPVQDALLVFGPRDRHELEVVWFLVQSSYEWVAAT